MTMSWCGTHQSLHRDIVSIPKLQFFHEVGQFRNTSANFVNDVIWKRLKRLELDSNRVLELIDFDSEETLIDFDNQDNRYLLLGSDENNLHIVDYDINRLKDLHPKCISSSTLETRFPKKFCTLQWCPGFNGLFVTTQDQSVKLWDTESMTPLETFELGGLLTCSDILQSNRTIAAGSKNQKIYLVDPRTGVHVSHLAGHKNEVNKVKWCPDSPHYLASGGNKGEVVIWDTRRSSSCLTKLDSKPERKTGRRAHSHTPITGLHWKSTNFLFTAGLKGKEVKRWNVLTNGHTSIRVEARDSHIRHMACSNLYGRRGCYIYVATGRNVTVIEEASGRLIHTLRGHPDPINHLVFNSHENELYSACRQLIAAWGNYPVGTRPTRQRETFCSISIRHR